MPSGGFHEEVNFILVFVGRGLLALLYAGAP